MAANRVHTSQEKGHGDPAAALMPGSTAGIAAGSVTSITATAGFDRSSGDAQQQNAAVESDVEASAEQSLLEGQTWMVLEYCDRGCLQVRALNTVEQHDILWHLNCQQAVAPCMRLLAGE
jgi:hypothetical protein